MLDLGRADPAAAGATEQDPRRVLFVYWGRRGAMSHFAVEIAEALKGKAGGDAISFAEDNELADRIEDSGPNAWPFRTFARDHGAITGLWRFRRQRRDLVRRAREEGFAAIIVLMSHVWTPMLGKAVKAAGLRYGVVVHDAAGHPGDPTRLVNNWLLRDPRAADRIIALTEAVAGRLIAERGVGADRITVVPHPALSYGRAARPDAPGPLRVLFLGRIMDYKGLPLLVEAMEILRAGGDAVDLGVYGEGDIDTLRPRLDALGATVVNRWIDHHEIGAILSQYDLIALPYVEASQSGVAAAAHGAAMPVVATPVGGLGEQVLHGVDGLLTDDVSAEALATAVASLARDRSLLRRLAEGAAVRREYTVPVFAARLKASVLGPPDG